MEMDNELLILTFSSEAEDILASMEESLLKLEKEPSDNETIRTLFRGAHTLKGNAACLGMEKIAAAVHGVEDYLDRLQRGSTSIDSRRVTLLLSFVDQIRECVRPATIGHDTVSPALTGLVAAISAAEETRVAAAAEPGVSSPSEHTPASASTVRVATSRLDRALDLTGEVSIARGRLRQLIDQRRPIEEISEAYRSLEGLLGALQELVMKLRMVPIGPFFRQYTRSVRDVAAAHEKHAKLVLEGEDVEVDLGVIEHLRNPLTHMIRNAIDHGIESPEARRAKGKDEEGTITLSAVRNGGTIVIRLADDGAGLNRGHIAARARKMGLIGETEKLPDPELFRFIFSPGFSTAEKVTDMSGRGLGMDVVRRNVEALHGTVNVGSRNGTVFTLRLPLTVAIIDGFVVSCGRESYVLPLDAVTECVAHQRGVNESDEDVYGVANLRGAPVPFVRLRRLFGLDAAPARKENLVVVRSEGRRAGVLVDSLVGERQLVIKPLGKIFQRISGLAGSAVLGDGRVAIILDVAALLDRCVAAVHEDQAAPALMPGAQSQRSTVEYSS